MQKFLNIISVISFLLVASISGLGVFSYFWITSETNQEKLKQQLMDQVTGKLKMPQLSGPVLPTSSPTGIQRLKKEKTGLSVPTF
tara:strand:+ start:7824 stop:8078 length:255 start_codon:yes stop_codon:yes gene_type:complete